MNSHKDYITALENQDYQNKNMDLKDLNFPQFDFNMFTSSIIFIANIIKLINIFAVITFSYIILDLLGINLLFWKIITFQCSSTELQTISIYLICSTTFAALFILSTHLSTNIQSMKQTYINMIDNKNQQIDELEDKIYKLETKMRISKNWKKMFQKYFKIYKTKTYETDDETYETEDETYETEDETEDERYETEDDEESGDEESGDDEESDDDEESGDEA